MDTATHITMGIALGGLATLDPTIANDPLMQTSVMFATIIGSHAPDFDTVLKLRNNAVIYAITAELPIQYPLCLPGLCLSPEDYAVCS